MATSTMQGTNGGIINWRPLISLPSSVGCAARRERAAELGDPQVHEVEIRVDSGRPTGVGRYDDRLRSRFLRDLDDLIPVIVVGGEQHLDVLLAHLVDDLEDVAGCGRNAGLRLDVVDTRHAVFAGEVIPLLVVARDGLATERHRFLKPPAEPAGQGGTL